MNRSEIETAFKKRSFLINRDSYNGILVLLVLVNIWSTIGHTSTFEAYCGDVALSCITNCPAFRQNCYSSDVANSIKNARPATTFPSKSDGTGTQPGNIIDVPQSPASVSVHLSDQENCAREGKTCIPVREYERSECCPGYYCIPHKHLSGKIAGIGTCKKVEYLSIPGIIPG